MSYPDVKTTPHVRHLRNHCIEVCQQYIYMCLFAKEKYTKKVPLPNDDEEIIDLC